MNILVTAFEPFGGETRNGSQEALALLPDELSGARIIKRVLPVAFGAASAALRLAVRAELPDAVLCLGQAGGRRALTVERVAVNLRDAAQPDNAGAQPADEPVISGAPTAFFSTLPIKRMVGAIRAAGLPAELSNSAGTFVCNEVMFTLLELQAREFPAARGGFLHLPWLSEQTAGREGAFGLSAEELARGVTAALEALVEDGAVPPAR